MLNYYDNIQFDIRITEWYFILHGSPGVLTQNNIRKQYYKFIQHSYDILQRLYI